MQLSEVAAERLIRLSTVIEHLVAGGEAAGWVRWNLGWCGLLVAGSAVPHYVVLPAAARNSSLGGTATSWEQ